MPASAGRRFLVTGAAGFVGRRLVSRLTAAGHDVVVTTRPDGTSLDRPDITTVACELTDSEAVASVVRRHAPENIVHLAASRSADPMRLLATNVWGLADLLAAAADVGAHLVNAGSSFEYGPTVARVDEEAPCRPTTAFGVAKLVGSEHVSRAVNDASVAACTLRLFHVYGPGEPAGRLVPRAFAAALDGTTLALTKPGYTHDLVHVDDVVDAFVTAADQRLADPMPVNVCTGVATTNEAVVDLVESVTGTAVRRAVGAFAPREWDRASWCGDPSRACDLLSFAPRRLRDGLSDLHTAGAPR